MIINAKGSKISVVHTNCA